MSTIPLLGPYDYEDVLAWQEGRAITCGQFLAEVEVLSGLLPERPAVINLTENRYAFLAGFAAALIRGQITLLPPGRSPQALSRIARLYPDSYCLSDGASGVPGLPFFSMPDLHESVPGRLPIPTIPASQTAAVVFTSGSTGQPRPNVKTWSSLTTVACHTAARLGLDTEEKVSIVATVPHAHMYGLETSIMLPTQRGWGLHAARPLFAADVRSTLAQVPPRRLLVTTPLHLRACIGSALRFPELELVLSATAPLSIGMAREAEDLFRAPVQEIYGFTEAGSVAMRRTTVTGAWRVLGGLTLKQDGNGCSIEADYLPGSIPLPDLITPHGKQEFALHGRGGDVVNIGGHRASLGDLNQRLNEIDGVEDGVFFAPDERDAANTRLIAFVVAPERSTAQILYALRNAIDPVFVPRPLYRVASLPRNDTGKLTHESLQGLVQACRARFSIGGDGP
ncbi:MAG: AMP-binding protein [Gammaproteobacteria bacterium]